MIADIQRRTGLSFPQIAAIDTHNDRLSAEAVLPILAEWIPVIVDDGLRAGAYSRFISPHASTYVRIMVDWLQQERYPRGRDLLVQALTMAARPTDAEWLWSIADKLPCADSHYSLIAKLAQVPAISTQVKDEIVRAIDAKELSLSDLHQIAEVDDPRITNFFELQLDADNRFLRQLAKRVVERGKRLPRGIDYAETFPQRLAELFSAEFDLEEWKDVVRQLAQEHGLKIPKAVREGAFFGRLPEDRWAVAEVKRQSGPAVFLWFRLERMDVVEVVLTEQPGVADRKSHGRPN